MNKDALRAYRALIHELSEEHIAGGVIRFIESLPPEHWDTAHLIIGTVLYNLAQMPNITIAAGAMKTLYEGFHAVLRALREQGYDPDATTADVLRETGTTWIH